MAETERAAHPCWVEEWHSAHEWWPAIPDPEEPRVLHLGLAQVWCPGVPRVNGEMEAEA